MSVRQRIVHDRRQYNQWVASQTLEDYALRYTAHQARRSPFRVGNTALGPIAFLACEAIGGSITLSYGFQSTFWAILAFAIVMFVIGLPIAYYAARYGVDIDLLTRGAGFGYLGSTITSLIYASFTFLLFAFEASIMSMALHGLVKIPLPIAYLVSTLAVIPIALYGFTLISRMQLLTQTIWLLLQGVPLIYVITAGRAHLAEWMNYPGQHGHAGGSFDLLLFGMALSMLLSLLPQIGEQVDYLRFLPDLGRSKRVGWWTALLLSGPGWVVPGAMKILAGSFLAVLAVHYGVRATDAAQPSEMYEVVFRQLLHSPTLAVLLTGLFVIVCQLKINVTNAYAGSIAWSNFFSRLTHSHPGRVVWLVFNVVLALLLMEIGIFRVINAILMIYANFGCGWIGALTADLIVNKPLGLSPPHIEFKRAYLYDINPVGVGALTASVLASTGAFLGVFGPVAQVISPILGLMVAFVAAPAIAWVTSGRYYLARQPGELPQEREYRCTICENVFDSRDMALCPAYSGPICSLCCTLEARCRDLCKTRSRLSEQITAVLGKVLPARWASAWVGRVGQFTGIVLLFNGIVALLLSFIYRQYSGIAPAAGHEVISTTLWLVFLTLMMLSAVGAWLIVLAHENRRTAEQESERQTAMLMEEIEAHKHTDAALQRAKEVAEAANVAKTRYIVGISHEIRTPLNSICGYAQLLERGASISTVNAVRVIRRSSEHLSNLVDGLLEISRIENGLLRLNRDKVRLPEFLDQLVDMFRLQAAAKGIIFVYSPPAKLPAWVHTDQKRLRQILINLLSNAIKYTEQGQASLSVRYRSDVAEFEVSDTGIGIPAHELERIFEPFERGSSPAVRGAPGTGLGLTITKLLTQIMGGEILVKSVVGEGTQFTVRLLLSQVREEMPATTNRPIRGYVGPRRSVLLVDDDPTHLDLLQSILGPLDFRLMLASNAAAALEITGMQTPDLALLDISMPGRSGWELARLIREASGGETIKIAMISANAHDSSAAPYGKRAPLNDAFLNKPIDLDLLLDLVRTLLGLEWTYDHPKLPMPAAHIEPPRGCRHHVGDLYKLGRIGHVRGIEAKLREIEAEHPDNAPFVASLRVLVESFDLKRYMSILEAIL